MSSETSMTTLLTDLTALLGESHIVTDKAALAPRLTDNRGRWHGDVLAAVLPADTSEVAEVMKIAARHRALVFTQGGNTGNAAGATPVVEPQDVSRSILILTDRMRRIEAIDTVNDTVTVQAGVPVAAIREAAAQKGRLFPLSLASDGTATAGGVLATNAGGVHVVRWGNARAQCLGLEAVLADGRVLNMLRGLRKDNTGYDVKQLFIGSEGTLGVITRAVFKLEPLPAERTVLWLTFGELETAEILFEKLEKAAGGMLSAFEVMHRTPLARVASVYPERTSGVPMSDAWSALVEFSCPSVREAEKIEETIEALSEKFFEEGLITDAVASRSEAQCRQLWAVRESIPEAYKKTGGNVKHDISVPRSVLAQFVRETNAALAKRFPWVEPSIFGHFGDGNLHYNVGVLAGQNPRLCFDFESEINALVYENVMRFSGSAAAEHGVGRMKRALLERTKSETELQLMRSVKRVLDPCGRLNPGAVVLTD